MSTFYDSPNDYRNYLCHYGVPNMKRPHGLKYKKRGGSLRAHRMEQARKVSGGLRGLDEERERRLREREEARQIANEHSTQDHANRAERSDREAYLREVQRHDEEKRRQQEILEEHMRQEAERRANTKGGSANDNSKRMQNFANQIGIMTRGRHQAMYHQQQIENRRRRRHGH